MKDRVSNPSLPHIILGIMSGLYHFSKSVSLSIKQKQKEHLLHKDLNMVN
jgi:hypothetical protein